MQEINFEDSVHEMMEEFKLTPSDNVWNQLEAGLNKKRKRRYFFVFSLSLCCCLIAGIFLFSYFPGLKNNFTKSNLVASNKTSINKTAGNENLKKETPQNKSKEIVNIDAQNSAALLKENSAAPIEILANEAITEKEKPQQYLKKQHQMQQAVNNSNVEKDLSDRNNNLTNDYADDYFSVEHSDQRYPNKMLANDIEKVNSKTNLLASSLNISGLKIAAKNAVNDKAAVSKKKKEKPANKKWHVEGTATAGIFAASQGAITNSIFSNGANNASALEIAFYTASAGVDSSVYAQSFLKKGATYSVGFNLLRSVSKRTSVSIGTGFRYSSTNIISSSYHPVFDVLTGTTQNNYFDEKQYKNELYYIDIPVEVQTLITGRSFPLYGNAGLVYSRVLKANTPQYSLERNVNISNNNSIPQNVFGVSAGLDVEIFAGKKSAFKIGPSLYYSFSKIADKSIYESTRFQFAGLRLKKTF